MWKQVGSSAGRVRRMAAGAGGFVLASAILVAGCEPAPSEPGLEVYSLEAVNGEALPGPYPDPQLPPDFLEVTAGKLTLYADGTLIQELAVRCATPQAPGTECEVEGDGTVSAGGRYFRTEGEVELGGTRYPAAFEEDRITVTIAVPPSQGFFFPSFVLDYRR